MSVKWIWYNFNEICVYLYQRKEKINLADIWDYKQMTSSVYNVDTNKLIPDGFPVLKLPEF